MRAVALPFALATLLTGQAVAKPILIIQTDEAANANVAELTFNDQNQATHPFPEKGQFQFFLKHDEQSCEFPLGASPDQKVRFNRPLALTSCAEEPLELKVRVPGDIQFTFDEIEQSIALKLLPKKTSPKPFNRRLPETNCPVWQGDLVAVDVSSTFKDGETLRDYYSGNLATVTNGQVEMLPAKGSNGMLLLELADHKAPPFSWDNLTVYFIMTDRFANGDTSNDSNFGRKKDGKDEIGTFHGGDIKGITQKLDYIHSLGANAIWMTPLVEQVHGFVGGGKNGEFPFYSYHGYWALDYTKLDPNFGTDADLRELVREAHSRGIRLIWDSVINHVGYATGQDLVDYNVDVFKSTKSVDNNWSPSPGQTWHDYHSEINYESDNWNQQWWDSRWIRADQPGYTPAGGDDITMTLAGLPDFITESEKQVSLPPLLKNKEDTRAEDTSKTVINHLIDWQAYWVREFGIDAFRSDTVKHVELEHWLALKDAGTKALNDWKEASPELTLDDAEFWMVGEVFDHPLFKDYYYDYGFDSLINFEFQNQAHELALCMTQIESTYQRYAKDINSDKDFNGLTYISSHDTTLFYAKYQNLELQKRIAAPFLLLPGGVQIYYGDESGRGLGPYGDDFHQGTRSDMNWSQIEGQRNELLKHWQRIGQFRNRHNSIGAGNHHLISHQPYAFSRTLENDKVVIVFAGNEQQ